MMRTYFLILAMMSVTVLAHGQYTEDEWKKRDKWMNVTAILEALEIGKGDVVADLGSHEGYMTLHLAKAVGESGKVYAVDVERYKLRNLEKNMKRKKVGNVETILGDYDDPKLEENSLDAIIIMDAYHEMKDYMTILGHVKKALKPGGRLVMLEEIDEFRKEDSRNDQTRNHDLGMNYAKEELQEAGFTITNENEAFGSWEGKKVKTIWLMTATRPEL